MERSQERNGGEGVAGREPGGEGLRLRREIGLWSAVSLMAGCMIGSGVFMSPQGVLVYMGSPGASLMVWAGCGLLAMMGALCYAELSALVPKSGGEYAYILQIFGSLPAFLVIYTFVLLVRPAAIAAVSLSFAEYAVTPFYPGCSSMPQAVLKGVAASCILLLTLVNCWSSRLATMLVNVCAVAKVFSLLVIVVGGAVVLGQGRGHTETFLLAFHNTTQQAGRIGMAFYQGMWSFDGWNNVNYVVEELKNPKQNLVWAVMIAIPLVTSLYLLVNISYLLVLSPNEILSSDAMAVSWGFLGWITYGTTIGCLLYLRIKKKNLPRPYKVPTIIPVIMLLASLYLVLAPIIDHPQIEFLYIFLFLLSGIPVYFLFVYFHCQPRCLQMATLYLQLLLEVAPTTKNVD
ncbi:b(0,+)-type amino acid transporter 1-like isoform X9 [Panthera pardus]|uniref:B(0,+)-type amino acid transporter 1-like isoform X9 n=1 Tax=Panthera pardus TaxID=9691 RepID=A0A9V1FPF6_PANPR|nr:b(0,+)-type amino acid transporter 1-like isoform X9 [Panthera pardus]XP_042838381.1 b(0,+)-type amino acid transporter 1-like isoform X4 [Panthera tigris]XP_060505516.1 b(0,+)-type amino acid transporter 1-like isoform X9 [Panthera onca]